MEEKRYRVHPQMIPPVILAMLLGIVPPVLEGATPRALLLLVLLLPFYYLGVEILARTIVVDEKGLTICKFLRSVRVDWADIRYLDAVQSGRKLFAVIQLREGRPVLITNTIGSFGDLANSIMQKLESDKISEFAKDCFSDPPSKLGLVVQAWIVCFVLAALIAGKLMGFGD